MEYKQFVKDRTRLQDTIPLDKPFSIFIEPTNRCTFSCICCPVSRKDYRQKTGGLFTLSLNDFNLIVTQIKQCFGSVKRLNFYMLGEPFLNKEILKFVKIAKEENIADKVVISTNASLLNEKMFNDIIQAKLDFLLISIYGLNQEEHEKVTKV